MVRAPGLQFPFEAFLRRARPRVNQHLYLHVLENAWPLKKGLRVYIRGYKLKRGLTQFSGVVPKARVAMIGLAGLELISATGEKLM